MAEDQHKLPASHQPDVDATAAAARNPSLIVYVVLLLTAFGMVWIAQSIQPDWPGLLVNLGTSLFSAVLLLIFIDRRFRQSEVSALMNMPARVGLLVSLTLSYRRRQLYRFCVLQLVAVDHITANKVLSVSFDQISKEDGSFVLLGEPGSGKTTVLQLLCAMRCRGHMADIDQPVPILYPVGRWLPDRNLEEAILEHIRGFHPVSKRALSKTLEKDGARIILDGADEIYRPGPDRFAQALTEIRARYPKVTWIISSRPIYPNPQSDLKSINLLPPSSEQIQEIFRRLAP